MSKSKKPQIIGVPWNFATVWNKTLDSVKDRPFVARNYIYASELGLSFCDRYLKMNAVPYTNPPNERSRRKFQAGNMWEWVVGMVFIAAGLLKKKQLRVEYNFKNSLSVHGKLDFVVGGAFDYDSAKKKIFEIKDSLMLLDLELPPFFFTAIDNFVDQHKGQLLQEVAAEFKSVSSFMMEKVQKTGAMTHHKLQDFHYVHGNDVGVQIGKVTYLCREDCIMEETIIEDDDATLKNYKSDIMQMTAFYNEGFSKKDPVKHLPPKETMVLFDADMGKFYKNFKVEYSSYLEMLYGFKTPKEFADKYQYVATNYSRVFKRCVQEGLSIKREGKEDLIIKLTPKNYDVIDTAKKDFPDWDKQVKAAKKSGLFNEIQENEDE